MPEICRDLKQNKFGQLVRLFGYLKRNQSLRFEELLNFSNSYELNPTPPMSAEKRKLLFAC